MLKVWRSSANSSRAPADPCAHLLCPSSEGNHQVCGCQGCKVRRDWLWLDQNLIGNWYVVVLTIASLGYGSAKVSWRCRLTFLLLLLCPFCGLHVLALFRKICSRHSGTFWCGWHWSNAPIFKAWINVVVGISNIHTFRVCKVGDTSWEYKIGMSV